jgi:hypothetical protein
MKRPTAGTLARYHSRCLDVGVHYFLVACLCALIAVIAAAVIDTRLEHWFPLTALLLALTLALEWSGPFWAITLDDDGVALRAAVWRRRARYEDIRFVQAGTLVESFTSAKSTQTVRIVTSRRRRSVQLDAADARECVRLIMDRARAAEAIDMTSVKLSTLSSLVSAFSAVREIPRRGDRSRARIARYYSSRGGCVLAVGLVMSAILAGGLIRMLFGGFEWGAALRTLASAAIVAPLAANLIALGRHLLKRAKRARR